MPSGFKPIRILRPWIDIENNNRLDDRTIFSELLQGKGYTRTTVICIQRSSTQSGFNPSRILELDIDNNKRLDDRIVLGEMLERK